MSTKLKVKGSTVTTLVAKELRVMLAKKGFTKRSKTWNRPVEDGWVQVIALESEGPAFTVQVGLESPLITKIFFTGLRSLQFTNFSGIRQCLLVMPLEISGELVTVQRTEENLYTWPGYWYTDSMPIEVLVMKAVTAVINGGLNYLNCFSTTDAIHRQLETIYQPPHLFLIMLHWQKEEHRIAREMLRHYQIKQVNWFMIYYQEKLDEIRFLKKEPISMRLFPPNSAIKLAGALGYDDLKLELQHELNRHFPLLDNGYIYIGDT